MTIFEIASTAILFDYYGRNYFVWTVQVHGFNLDDSNTFRFTLVGKELDGTSSVPSTYFNITTPTSSFVPAISLITPSSAPLNGPSRETLGIALGIGIPGLIAILAILFVLLNNIKLLKRGTPRQQRFEVAGDFTYRTELSGDRNSSHPPHFAELPA